MEFYVVTISILSSLSNFLGTEFDISFVGSLCYMSGSIQMENVYLPENEVGMWQWLFGKTAISIFFINSGPSDGFVGIAAPSLARILPVCGFLTDQYFFLKNISK